MFPVSDLRILDYNRVVRDLNGLSDSEFLKAVSEVFEVREADEETEGIRTAGGDQILCKGSPYRPAKKGEFGMFLSDSWYILTAKPEIRSGDPVKGLDVSILQDYLLDPILGIKDPKTDPRIDFVGGIRGLEELERRVHEGMKVAFSMYPTSMEELLRTADAGLLMPPKSTWFEPKLRSGILIHEIER